MPSIGEIRTQMAKDIYRIANGEEIPPVEALRSNLVIRYEAMTDYDKDGPPTIVRGYHLVSDLPEGIDLERVWRAALRLGRLPQPVLDHCKETAKVIAKGAGLSRMTMLVYPVWYVVLGLEFIGPYTPIYIDTKREEDE